MYYNPQNLECKFPFTDVSISHKARMIYGKGQSLVIYFNQSLCFLLTS